MSDVLIDSDDHMLSSSSCLGSSPRSSALSAFTPCIITPNFASPDHEMTCEDAQGLPMGGWFHRCRCASRSSFAPGAAWRSMLAAAGLM